MHKLKGILADFAVLILLHYANVLVLTGFIWLVLGVDLGSSPGWVLLVDLAGTLIGVGIRHPDREHQPFFLLHQDGALRLCDPVSLLPGRAYVREHEICHRDPLPGP